MLRLLAGSGRTVAAWLTIVLLSPVGSTPVGAAPARGLSGSVKDRVGNLLEDVEVLVLAGVTSRVPAFVAWTGLDGRFSVRDLAPGTYRIAALKPGYFTFVGEVDTGRRNWIDLILDAVPEIGDAAPAFSPERASWVLRLPRRDVLREVEPGTPSADGERSETEGAAPSDSSNDKLQIQLDHLVDFRAKRSDATGDRSGAHGTETLMRVASSVGERGNIQMLGRHENLDSLPGAGVPSAPTRRDASALRLAFSYDTSLDTRLAVQAFYSEHDFRWSPDVAEAGAPLRRQQRSWGYDARWTRQLDSASKLALQLDYQDERLQLPGRPRPESDRLEQGSGKSLSNRTVGAGGTFQSLPADDHQVQVAFRAKLEERPGTDLPGFGQDPLAAVSGRTALTVGIEAQDTWYVCGPFSLLYGLGYKHRIATEDESLIVPRLGGTWSLDGLVLRGVVAYHAVADWTGDDPDAPDGPAAFRPAGRFGYELGAELPLSRALSLRGTARFSPLQFDLVGYDLTSLDAERDPIYVSDGNAAVEQQSLALVGEAGNTQAYVEIGRGEAEGSLSAIHDHELPFGWVADRRVRYANARFGVRRVPAGTHVRVEYARVEEGSALPLPSPGQELQESLELRLTQDLLRLDSLGNWRLLMAARIVSLEENEAADPPDLSPRNPSSRNHRLSAGLSVLF